MGSWSLGRGCFEVFVHTGTEEQGTGWQCYCGILVVAMSEYDVISSCSKKERGILISTGVRALNRRVEGDRYKYIKRETNVAL
jgi:hypothetical protein